MAALLFREPRLPTRRATSRYASQLSNCQASTKLFPFRVEKMLTEFVAGDFLGILSSRSRMTSRSARFAVPKVDL